jgi:hypothetical protein
VTTVQRLASFTSLWVAAPGHRTFGVKVEVWFHTRGAAAVVVVWVVGYQVAWDLELACLEHAEAMALATRSVLLTLHRTRELTQKRAPDVREIEREREIRTGGVDAGVVASLAQVCVAWVHNQHNITRQQWCQRQAERIYPLGPCAPKSQPSAQLYRRPRSGHCSPATHKAERQTQGPSRVTPTTKKARTRRRAGSYSRHTPLPYGPLCLHCVSECVV